MTAAAPPARVAALWRYPVKSVAGEARDFLRLEARGVRGDRAWALRDAQGKLGSGKTTRRFRFLDGLLEFGATLPDAAHDEDDGRTGAPRPGSGPPMLRFPDGRVFRAGDPAGDAALSAWFGEPLVLAPETGVPHLDAGPVHLLTSSSLAWLCRMLPGSEVGVARFRPNLLLATEGEGPVESGWMGHLLGIGEAQLRIREPTQRCVMVAAPQGALGRDPGILRELAQRVDACFGVYADVVVPGIVRRGDTVRRID